MSRRISSNRGRGFFERRGGFGVEAVAKAADGANEEGVGGIGFDFVAQAEDVDVDGAVGDGAVLAPYGVEELLAAEDDAGAAHQVFEEAELGGGEEEFLAIVAHA